MRLLLAILVGVVQAAGPLLCCCLPARLAAATPAPVEPTLPAEPVCSHCRTAKPEPAAPAKDHKKPPVPHRCPCGGQSVQAATPKLIQPPSDLEPVGLTPAVSSLVSNAGLPRASVAPSGVSDLPFLTTDARLYTHHALRC
ncbi:MAG: hypothetical protein U0871_15970 [Gemmataceae bacterium]